MAWTPLSSDVSEIEEISSTNPTWKTRNVVFVALGISAGLVVAALSSNLRSNPQPPVEVNTKGMMQARGWSAMVHATTPAPSQDDFYKVCATDYSDKPGHYTWMGKTMPSSAGGWSYEKVDHCDLTTLKACQDDSGCAGLAGHDDPYKNWPQCWRIKVGKHSTQGKGDWWTCMKKDYDR